MTNKSKLLFLLLIVFIIFACKSKGEFSSFYVPETHYPPQVIELKQLNSYIIAYCWRPTNARASIDFPELQVVHTVIQNGSNTRKGITEEYPTLSIAFVNMVGCLSEDKQGLRTESGKISWRPKHNEIGILYGTGRFTPDFKLFSIESDLSLVDNGDPVGVNGYFANPEDVFWSPDGSKFATRAYDVELDKGLGYNIWAYEIETKKFTRISNIEAVGNYVENASWSSAGDKIAVGYGVPFSGIAISEYNNPENYLEITSETVNQLSNWPYVLDTPLDALKIFFAEEKVYNFNLYITDRSLPVWINNDEQIIFVAANKQQRATFFIVNSDGTELKELLPEFPGILGLPTLSPDKKTLAFIRYPNWKNNDRVEIATLNIETLEIKSLAVFPAPENGDELWISGLSWTPDGEYLAVSSPHTGESEIYVISKDGSAWVNLTENMEGDTVSPAWKP